MVLQEPPTRVIRRSKSALAHGRQEERRDAAAAYASLASTGRAACDALMEVSPQLVRILTEDSDDAIVRSALLTLELMSAHLASEVSEIAGLNEPLIALLDSPSAIVRLQAVRCVAMMCEDEHGLASRRLLDVKLVPALTRLAASEREQPGGSDTAALCAISTLTRLSSEARFSRDLIDGNIHTVLLAFASPSLPSASDEAKEAQLAALTCIERLARSSDFKSALSHDHAFFPLLFTLRDSLTPGVSEHAYAIAKHWGDDFFGWAWEVCSVCKDLARRMALEPRTKPAPPTARVQPLGRVGGPPMTPTAALPTGGGGGGMSGMSGMSGRAAASPSPAPPTHELGGDDGASGAGPHQQQAPPAARAHSSSSAAASGAALSVADEIGGVEKYHQDLHTMGHELREFFAHADAVSRGLMHMQADLDDAARACEEFVSRLRRSNLIAADAADAMTSETGEQPPAEAFAARCRKHGHSIEHAAESVRTSSRKLLLHCNLLVDCQQAVEKAEGELRAVDDLVRRSAGLEVSVQWRRDAHAGLKKALIVLCMRLELYVRSLLAQKEGSGSLLSRGGCTR